MEKEIRCVMKLKEDINLEQFLNKTRDLADDLVLRDASGDVALYTTSKETFERLTSTTLVQYAVDSHPHWEYVRKPTVPKELQEYVYELDLQNSYSFIKTEPTD